MSGGAPSFELHSRCEIARLGEGEVVFVGGTSFATGVWVGVVLDETNGKNNGTVMGKRYFDCPEGHGVFVRPSQVHPIPGSFSPVSAASSPPMPATTPGRRTAATGSGSMASHSRSTSGLENHPASRGQSPVKAGRPSAAVSTPRARIAGSLGPGVGRTAPAPSTPSSTIANRMQKPLTTPRVGAAAVGARGVGAASTPRALPASTTPATSRSTTASVTRPGLRTSVSAATRPTMPARTGTTASTPGGAGARTPGMTPSAARISGTATGASTPAYGSASAAAARRQSLVGSGFSRSAASTPAGAQGHHRTQSRVSRTSSSASSTVSSGMATPASAAAAARRAGVGPATGAARVAPSPAVRARTPASTAHFEDFSSERTPRRAGTGPTAATPGAFSATRRDSLLSRGGGGTGQSHSQDDEDLEEDILNATLADAAAELDGDEEDLLMGGGTEIAAATSTGRTMTSSPTLEEAVSAELDEHDPSASPTAPYSHNRTYDSGPTAGPTSRSRTAGTTAASPATVSPTAALTPVAPIPRPNHMSLASSTSTSHLPRTAAEVGELMHELEELRARVRMMEKKREEEREAMRAAERKAEEAEGKERAVEKLQERLKEIQASLKDQGKLERELEQLRDDYERQIVDANEQLEMAMLDKEVAEEKYEVLAHDAEILREEKEEMQLDRDLAREELAMFEQGEVPEADRASTEFIKLERQNMRLQDALLRVRDVGNEMEADLKHKITELDKELASLSDIQMQYEKATARLEVLESANEDLRSQLDAALGAEEMLETLTERNLNLAEKLDMSKLEIEELTEMCQVSQDIEQVYEEDLRTLQEEIYGYESMANQLQSRLEALQAEVVEQDAYIHQYRELVQTLNGEMEALRAERTAELSGVGEDGFETDGVRARAVAQSQAQLEKEFQITRSASKKQAKTIEIELGKLKESQAMHQLDIIRSYLPPVYFNGDADAVAALLFFRRMSLKADIIKTVLESSHDIQDSLNNIVPEGLIEVCMLRNQLTHFGAISRQISSVMNFASAEDFLRAGQEFRSFQHIEKRIDYYLDALRNQELKEAECGNALNLYSDDFHRFVITFKDSNDAGLPSLEVGVACMFEQQLDTLAAAFGFAKQRIAALYQDEEVEWHLGSRSLEADVFDPLQQLINNIRITKVPARKLTRRLQTLFVSDETIRESAVGAMPLLTADSQALVNFATTLASSFSKYTAEVRTNKTPFVMSNIVSFVDEATNEALKKSDQVMWSSAISMTNQLLQTINQILASATEQENIIKITGTKPWLTRVKQIQTEMTHNVDAERHISSQSEEIVHLRRTIKQREQFLQEHAVKIERLQIHLNRSKEQVDQMTDLRKQLDEARKQAKDYQEANDQLQADLDRAEQEKTTLVQQQQQQQQAAVAQASAQQKAAQQGGGELGPDGSTFGSGGGPGGNGDATGLLNDGGGSRGGRGGGGPGSGFIGDFAGVGGMPGGPTGVLGYANLETSYLVDQLEAMRGAVRYLRTENSYLRGSELMRGWKALAPLTAVSNAGAAASDRIPLGDRTNLASGHPDRDGESKEGDEDGKGEPVQQKSMNDQPKSERLRLIAAETQRLHSQALELAVAPRIVDLSVLVSRTPASASTSDVDSKKAASATDEQQEGDVANGTTTTTAATTTATEGAGAAQSIRRPAWQPAARLPQNQYRAQKELAAKIRARVEALSERVRRGGAGIGFIGDGGTGGGGGGGGTTWTPSMISASPSVVAAS
ncbi:unnamed protein product [Tilletia controversa]|uniref:CAP-Gly domain-containing protein n=1 Tax=Tilletia controversa TaxID=13291 RepID=A0A8X7MYQ3_9BASI|nr:hypothetical protein CF328_g268 [Tilletia controversa]KAE8254651.1 hypothetical protein A4X06_0g798 [Tilletia controversa]CAD6910970.1 unnamed protein product [Tilletia controversa]CAD6911890.1 unnamed protein product [Tilletia controversa]CAD6983116.1 unnamed protein product [Tilletia controversa]